MSLKNFGKKRKKFFKIFKNFFLVFRFKKIKIQNFLSVSILFLKKKKDLIIYFFAKKMFRKNVLF